jgi:transposase
MFIRTLKTKGTEYLVLAESYREDGKIKQRHIASLGRVETLEEKGQLEQIAKALLKFCKKKSTFDIFDAEEKERKLWGAVRIVKALWDKFEFDKFFKKLLRGTKIDFDFLSAVFLMLMDRLIEPKSRLRSFQEQHKYHGVEEIKLHHLYKALDLLCHKKEEIEKYIFEKNCSLFNMKVDVVLYDVSTLYFESVNADEECKDFGFSKDCKFKEVQVVFGLIVDMEGRPVGFDIFKGNTFEGHTLKTAVSKLKNQFNIENLIFVGDRAMISKENIELIESLGYSYIVGSRAKRMERRIQDQILSQEGYSQIEFPKSNSSSSQKENPETEEIFKYKEINLSKKHKLICTWSSKRARKDKADRHKLIEKAKDLIKNKKGKKLSRRGALKYIEMDAILGENLNEEKIRQDEKWDGYYALQTNCNLTSQTISQIYHDLWKIEESFRVFKSHLELRPIFVWTPNRIRGHFVLSFIAFLLERTLEIELKKQGIEYSTFEIRKSLESLQFSVVEIEGETFYLRSKIDDLSAKILETLQIKKPPRVAKPDKF